MDLNTAIDLVTEEYLDLVDVADRAEAVNDCRTMSPEDLEVIVSGAPADEADIVQAYQMVYYADTDAINAAMAG